MAQQPGKELLGGVKQSGKWLKVAGGLTIVGLGRQCVKTTYEAEAREGLAADALYAYARNVATGEVTQ